MNIIMVSINLNLKQLMAISNDFSSEEFKKAIEQFDKKEFVEYLVELQKEEAVNDDEDNDDINEFR